MATKAKFRNVKAWADVGSHGDIFVFEAGTVAGRYPTLMHIYSTQVAPDMVPVTITYELARGRKREGSKP